MKSSIDHLRNAFKGEREKITITELRHSPGDVLNQVQLGKVFDITKNGVVVAVLQSPEPSALQLGAELRRLEKKEQAK